MLFFFTRHLLVAFFLNNFRKSQRTIQRNRILEDLISKMCKYKQTEYRKTDRTVGIKKLLQVCRLLRNNWAHVPEANKKSKWRPLRSEREWVRNQSKVGGSTRISKMSRSISKKQGARKVLGKLNRILSGKNLPYKTMLSSLRNPRGTYNLEVSVDRLVTPFISDNTRFWKTIKDKNQQYDMNIWNPYICTAENTF